MLNFAKKMFKIGDWIHFGLVLIFSTFGIWGIVKESNFISTFISIFVILTFIFSFIMSCYMKLDEYRLVIRLEEGIDIIYLAKMDVILYLSPRTRFFREQNIQILVDNLLKFWNTIFDVKEEELIKLLKGTKIYLHDEKEFIMGDGRKVLGYAFEKAKTIQIATLPKIEQTLTNIENHVNMLLKHELSHIIVCNYKDEYCGDLNGHALFNKVGTNF